MLQLPFWRRIAAAGFVVLAAPGCRDTSAPTPGATGLTPVSGDHQYAEVGDTMPAPLVVRVTDARGTPRPGVLVAWLATGGGGTAQPDTVVTDSAGLAQARWVLGPTAGEQELGASAGTFATVSFHGQALPAVAVRLVLIPDAIGIVAGLPPEASRIHARLEDRFGNARSGGAFTWSSSDSGVVRVDTAGVLSARSPGRAGVRARAGGLQAEAEVTVLAGPATLRAVPDSLELRTGDAAWVHPLLADGEGRSGPATNVAWTQLGGPGGYPLIVTDAVRLTGAEIGTTRYVGALGSGPADTVVVRVHGIAERLVQLAAGGEISCALDTAGRAYCWGRVYGATGEPLSVWPSGWHLDELFAPAPVGGGLRFRALAVGANHACGIALDGTAWCWYANAYGALGRGTATGASTLPVRVAGSQSLAALAAGGWHTCALTADGRAWCWGVNQYGQLGDGSRLDRYQPVPVAGDLVFRSLSAGYYHTCGITAGGRTYCWGYDRFGELGRGGADTCPDALYGGSGACTLRPKEIDSTLRFAAIAVGGFFTCALTADGTGWCWGHGVRGELGDGRATTSPRPVAVGGGHRFSMLAASFGRVCGIAGTDALCWGDATFAHVTRPAPGDDSCTEQGLVWPCWKTPRVVAGGHAFTSVSAGRFHACGMTDEGAVCWGDNGWGQLGAGSASPDVSPDPLPVYDGRRAGLPPAGVTARRARPGRLPGH